MSQKTYLWILKGGVFLSFITFFFVFKNLLFPYITSKQLSFNILVEVLAIFWIAFLIKYPEWRPKWSWISGGLIAFFAATLITAFTGVDFNLSFWGDIERMLGWFHIAHFLLFYFIIITVFREKRDWLWLFNASLVVALFISFNSISQRMNGEAPYSTIGNTAYVAGYLIFNIYFALLLFVSYKNIALKSLYALSLIPLLIALWNLYNSGSLVGLGLSVLLLLFLFGAFNKEKKIKIATRSALLIMTLAIILVFSNKNSGFVKNNKYLSKVTFLISSNKTTFQTRLISWRGAAKDFKNHPILGTGYGNYAITFDKYFDPKFYDYSKGETYFDRAHNNLIDITSTTGILGLFSYLSIFAAVGYYMINRFRSKKIGLNDFAVMVSLVVAYFIQNLAVFDSLVTYTSLMMMLGYIYWMATASEETVTIKDRTTENKEFYALIAAALVMLAIVYQYNIKPWKMLISTIDAQRAYAQGGDISKAMDIYKQALSYNTGLDRDSRTTFMRLVNQGSSGLYNLDKKKAGEVFDYAVDLCNKNLAYNAHDSLQQMECAQLLNTAATFYSDNQEKFSFYVKQAEDAINKSIDASPRRVPIYFSKAQILLTEGRKDDAVDTLKYAISLNTKYSDGYCQLGKYYLYFKNEKEGYANIDSCIDLDGTGTLYPDSFVKSLFNHYYAANDQARMLKVLERLSTMTPKDAKIWISLAKLYAKDGQNDKAKDAALRAAQLDPSLKDGAENFVKSLNK